MKLKILEALKAKFEGVNEAILNRIAEKLAKTVTKEEDVATAVEGVTFQQVLDSYGDSRATEAQKTAVRNYEQKYSLKDGKVIEGGKPGGTEEQPKVDGDTPEWAKTLIQQNQQLTERLNRLDTDRIAASRREELNAILEKMPENLRKGYERISVDKLTEEEFSQLKTDVTSEVESITKDLGAKGAVFGIPGASGKKVNDGKLTEAQTKAITQRTGVPADDQQPF